jgi:hypothetical protein
MLNGPDTLIASILDVQPAGTLAVYTDWEMYYDPLIGTR